MLKGADNGSEAPWMNQPPGKGQNEPENPGHRRSDPPPNDVARHAATTVRALGAASRVQSLVALLLALGLMLVGPVAAWSSIVGSLAVYLPSVLFTLLVARKIGADSASFLRTAALAELAKLFLTGLLCALVFIWVKPLAPGWFFTGMLAVLASSWIGLARAIR